MLTRLVTALVSTPECELRIFETHFAFSILVSSFVMNLTNASGFKVQILKGVQVLVVDNDNESGEMYDFLLNHFDEIVTLSIALKSVFPDIKSAKNSMMALEPY